MMLKLFKSKLLDKTHKYIFSFLVVNFCRLYFRFIFYFRFLFRELLRLFMKKEVIIFKSRELLEFFMNKEMINFESLLELFGKELQSHEIFNQETAHGKKCWTELKTRVIEHVSPKVKFNWQISNFISHRTFESAPIT